MMLIRKRDALLAEAARHAEELRWDWLIARARNLPALPEDERIEANRVIGCIVNLWVVPSYAEGRCQFRCAADSAVAQAVAGLLCDFYSGAAPEEILALEPSFLRSIGITEHLTSHRRNSLTKVWALIRDFAARHAGNA